MEDIAVTDRSFDQRMAGRLKAIRIERGWSLDELSARCGISRATLSRLENAEVSPTASVLGKLCASYGLPVSRLMAEVEADFDPLVRHGEQAVWQDPESGFIRRSVSPPAQSLGAELLDCVIPAGKRIEYARPPSPGLEHHLYMLDGRLTMTIEDRQYELEAGDCLRYQLRGPSAFETRTDSSARYVLAIL